MNLHGGVLAGVGLIGVCIGVRVVRGRLDKARSPTRHLADVIHPVLLGVACIVALALNPYGVELIRFLLRTATVPRPEISEWTPLALLSLPGQIYLGLLAIGMISLVRSRHRREPEAILILAATAVSPLISNRHYPLFALTLIVLGGEHIADSWDGWWPAGHRPSSRGRGIVAASLVISLLLIGLSVPRFGCIRVDPFYFPFPARAVALLKRAGVRGNMAVPFDWGEYVIWHLGPEVKVSIDGRRETVYSDESLPPIARLRAGDGGLGCPAQDLAAHRLGPGSERVADFQPPEPNGRMAPILPGYLLRGLRPREPPGPGPARDNPGPCPTR